MSLPMEKLVKQAQKGDRDAMSQLIQHTQNNLFRFLYFLTSNEALAGDLCQDTYIKALDSISRLKDPGKFESWLKKIARNLFLDYTRTLKDRDFVDLDTVDNETCIENEREEVIQIRRLLSTMDPKSRMCLVLVDMENYSYGEAAEITGISENAFRSRLHRARQEFLEKYAEAETNPPRFSSGQ